MKNLSQFKKEKNIYNNIEFELQIKDIRNLIIKLNAKNEIIVSIPKSVPEKILIEFLDANLEKFYNHANEKKENSSINLKENWFYLFGQKMFFEDDKLNKKIIINNKKISYLNISKEDAINKYRKKELNVYLLIRQLQFQKIMNIDDHLIRVREKERAWATNHVLKKTIYYSVKLSAFSKEIIDYVIVHELAHNKEPNHSKKFWEIVSKYEPEYKLKRYKLKKGKYL